MALIGTLAVDRLAQRVDDATEQFGPDRHFQDTAGGLDDVTFGDMLVLAKYHHADRVALEVQREAEGVAGELDHLALHHVRQAVNAADAIRHRHHRALVTGIRADVQVLNLALEQFADFSGIELHEWGLLSSFQSGGELGQLAAHGCVDHFVADTDRHAADQVVVDVCLCLDLTAIALLQGGDDVGDLLFVSG